MGIIFERIGYREKKFWGFFRVQEFVGKENYVFSLLSLT